MNISDDKTKDTYWEYCNILKKIYEETQSFIELEKFKILEF